MKDIVQLRPLSVDDVAARKGLVCPFCWSTEVGVEFPRYADEPLGLPVVWCDEGHLWRLEYEISYALEGGPKLDLRGSVMSGSCVKCGEGQLRGERFRDASELSVSLVQAWCPKCQTPQQRHFALSGFQNMRL